VAHRQAGPLVSPEAVNRLSANRDLEATVAVPAAVTAAAQRLNEDGRDVFGEDAARRHPLFRQPALFGVVGQQPADHFLIARGQVDLVVASWAWPQDELYVGEREDRVLGHPVCGRVPQRMQRRRGARRSLDPLEHRCAA